MAYTFNAINTMLGNDQNKQDIFNQGTGGADAQSSSPAAQGQSSQPVSKDVGGGALGSQNQSQQSQAGQGQAKSSSAQAIVSKAQKGNLDTSKFTQGIQQNISQNQQKLEDEANSFVSNQVGRARQAVDSNTARAAAQGDANAYNQLEQTIRGPRTQAENFQFTGSTKFQDLDNLSTQGGLQSALSRKGPATYNQGQAALDAMLISRDKNYQQNLQKAKQDRDVLRKRQAELEAGGSQSQAQSIIDQKEAEARTQALADLANLRQQVDLAVNQRQGNYFNLLEQAKQRSPIELAQMENELRQEIARENANLGDFASRADVDESNFATFNTASRGRDQFYTPEQAQQYNRILDLLGESGIRSQGVQDLGAYSTYNRQGMKQALLDQARRSKEADDARKAAQNTERGYVPMKSNSGGYVGQAMKKIFGR